MDLGIGLGASSSALLTAYIIVANSSERLDLNKGRFWSAARQLPLGSAQGIEKLKRLGHIHSNKFELGAAGLLL